MIREVDRKPSAFRAVPDHCRWFRLEMDESGELYGWLALQDEHEAVGVHLEILFFTPSVMKQMVQDWPRAVKTAKNMGAKVLYATNFDYTDTRWPKLIKYFGFPNPVVLAFSQQEV